ncbi:MAG: hypothetical protein EA422_07140 [Gemmatimonadales bacterium]|nr:MAG: hypothetical protein EA422_07140 [Gemmatimonadales bacterium]
MDKSWLPGSIRWDSGWAKMGWTTALLVWAASWAPVGPSPAPLPGHGVDPWGLSSDTLVVEAPQATDEGEGPLSAALDQLLGDLFEPDKPGAAVFVSTRDRDVVKARGLASMEHGLPITLETVFDGASVAKQFTALGLALLVERELLSLDDPVRRWLPEFPAHEPPVRIHHLLHHTSGVRDWPGLLLLAGWRFEDVLTHEQILRVTFGQADLNFPAGSRTTYSNTGYVLLAEIIGRRSGMAFPEFMRQEIFGPLGMRDTRIAGGAGEVIPRRATSYRVTPDEVRGVPSNLSAWGSSSLFTSAGDLLRWVEFLHGGESAALELRAAAERLAEAEGPGMVTPRYGWGQVVEGWEAHRLVRHGGAWAGYRSALLRLPEQQIAVGVLGNRSDLDADALAESVLSLVLAEGDETPTESVAYEVGGVTTPGNMPTSGPGVANASGAGPAPDPPEADAPRMELSEYLGDYRNVELESTYNLTPLGDALLATHARLGHHLLRAVGPDHFRSVVFGEIRFQRDSRGRITGFTAHQPRNTGIRFQRVDS